MNNFIIILTSSLFILVMRRVFQERRERGTKRTRDPDESGGTEEDESPLRRYDRRGSLSLAPSSSRPKITRVDNRRLVELSAWVFI